MALEAKQVALCITKVLRTSIRKGYICVSERPVLFSFGVLLYLLYRSSPGFVAFLLSSSPVIVCTTLLLGILLSYGDANLPEVDEDSKITPVISAFKVGNSSDDIHFEENQRFSMPGCRKNAANFKEKETKQTVSFRERAGEHIELDDDVPLLRRVDKEDERFDRRSIPRTLTPFPSMVNFHQEDGIGENLNFNQERESKDSLFMKDKADRHTSLFEGVLLSGLNEKDASFGMFSSCQSVNKHGEMEENLNQETVFIDSAAIKVRETSEKLIEGLAGTSRPACAVSMHQRKRLDELKIDAMKAVEDNLLDSSLGSPWARVGSQDGSSGFDSDQAESSSPDASMTDIAPVLDEIDPLLGADSTRPDPIPKDNSDTDSHVSSQDHQTDDDSNDEADNNDAKDNGEEKKKDDVKEAAFIWTADDEKNLMDLGYSEMERNRRLEILMARRRSRKNIRFDIENDLIDINSNDAGRSSDDLPHFRVQVPHISVPRRNPFDLPNDPEEAAIPGSAPSILHTQKNPFDHPLEQSNDSGVSSHDNLSPGESLGISHRDLFFRRHESFNFRSTYVTQEKHFSRFKPYFVPETVEGSTSNFPRQFSDKSESKLSSVTESDMASSVADQEDHKDLGKKDLHGEHGSRALPRQDNDLADAGSECSDGINSVDVELDHSDIDDREIALQHFVFERSQEREAYLAAAKGKGHEQEYLLKSAGNSMKPLHPVADLLTWEDGDGESGLGAKSPLERNTAVEFSEWVSSPRPAEDLQEYLDTEVASTPNTIVLGATNQVEKDGDVEPILCSNNEMPLDNMIHGSMELASEFGNETLPVISRDLHPIPEERAVENLNMRERHELEISTDSATALTGLHVIEEHFDVGSEGSLSSAVVSSCPQASESIQSSSVEPAKITNPLISMTAEPNEVDIGDMKEETTAGFLLDSDDEGDKIYPEPSEDNVIDESFLSELDAVGDFRVEPMRLDQQVPDLGSHTDNPPANGVAANSLISPQTSGNISLTLSDASVLDSWERSPLADDLYGTDPEFGWSLRASHDDPEQTVYNPRRRILETIPFQAMNAELKPLCDETKVPSVSTPSTANLAVGSSELVVESDTTNADAKMIILETIPFQAMNAELKPLCDDTKVPSVSTPSTANLAVGSSELEVESGPTNTNVQMIILDAKSLEDIEAAFKQVTDGIFDKSTPDIETSHVSGVDTDSEPLEGAGQLHAVDAKSVDDVYAAFKEQSCAVANSSLEENEENGGCGETAEVTRHDKRSEGTHVESLYIVGDGREPEPMETIGNMSSMEAKTLDDIDAVFKKL